MIVQQTLTQLRALNLEGMAAAFEEQLTLPSSNALAFEDRVALLVEREAAHRDGRRLTRLLAKARFKYAQACVEDLDTRASRGLDARLITSLAHGQWIERGQPILIAGPTGAGQNLARRAWRKRPAGLAIPPSMYVRRDARRKPRIARGDGTPDKRRLLALAKIEVLVLDDWALQPLEPYGREDLLEIMDDRAERHATIITAQLPIEHWHGWIGDATIADAILDRLLHHAHRLTLKR